MDKKEKFKVMFLYLVIGLLIMFSAIELIGKFDVPSELLLIPYTIIILLCASSVFVFLVEILKLFFGEDSSERDENNGSGMHEEKKVKIHNKDNNKWIKLN